MTKENSFTSSASLTEDNEELWFLDPKTREDAARRRSQNWISMGRPLPATPTKRRSISRLSNMNDTEMIIFSDEHTKSAAKDDLMTPKWIVEGRSMRLEPGGGVKPFNLETPDDSKATSSPNNPFGQDEFNVTNPFEPQGKTPSYAPMLNNFYSPAPGFLKSPMPPPSAIRLGSPSPGSLPPLRTPGSRSCARSLSRPLRFDPFMAFKQAEKNQTIDFATPFYSPRELSRVDENPQLPSFSTSSRPRRKKLKLDFNTPCNRSLPNLHLDFNTPLRPSLSFTVEERLSATREHKSVSERRLSSIPPPTEDKIGKDFLIGRLVGSGDFGEVYRVRKKSDGKEYALKILKRSQQQNGDKQLTEADALKRVNRDGPHQHVLKFEQAWTFQGKIHILTELCVHGNLDQVISNNPEFPEEDIWRAVVQISLGLGCIHKNGLLHLDIKSANIFVEVGGVLKIGDFGTSREIGKVPISHGFKATGTASHLAPEQFNENLGAITEKADIFSMGIVTFELATSVIAPANGPKWQHLRSGKKLSLPKSESLGDLVHGLLKRSPERRISLDAVLKMARTKGIEDPNTNLKLVKLPPPVRRSLSSGSPQPRLST